MLEQFTAAERAAIKEAAARCGVETLAMACFAYSRNYTDITAAALAQAHRSATADCAGAGAATPAATPLATQVFEMGLACAIDAASNIRPSSAKQRARAFALERLGQEIARLERFANEVVENARQDELMRAGAETAHG